MGITINVKHLDESGYLDCLVDNNVEAEPIQFHLQVLEDCELLNETTSCFKSINNSLISNSASTLTTVTGNTTTAKRGAGLKREAEKNLKRVSLYLFSIRMVFGLLFWLYNLMIGTIHCLK